MTDIPAYSTLLSCIYDEQEPIGNLGRGTHYSVLRSIEWLDVTRQRLPVPEIHDFAVVWDEDHDTRVIPVIERIYMAGLLSPIQFIGERKGGLTVIVAARFYFAGSENETELYRQAIEQATNLDNNDCWNVTLGSFDRQLGSPQQTFPESLINADETKVITYLRNIDNLWNIGSKPYSPKKLS